MTRGGHGRPNRKVLLLRQLRNRLRRGRVQAWWAARGASLAAASHTMPCCLTNPASGQSARVVGLLDSTKGGLARHLRCQSQYLTWRRLPKQFLLARPTWSVAKQRTQVRLRACYALRNQPVVSPSEPHTTGWGTDAAVQPSEFNTRVGFWLERRFSGKIGPLGGPKCITRSKIGSRGMRSVRGGHPNGRTSMRVESRADPRLGSKVLPGTRGVPRGPQPYKPPGGCKACPEGRCRPHRFSAGRFAKSVHTRSVRSFS